MQRLIWEVPEALQLCTSLFTRSLYAVIADRYGSLCVGVSKDV